MLIDHQSSIKSVDVYSQIRFNVLWLTVCCDFTNTIQPFQCQELKMDWWLSGMQDIVTEFGFVCEMFTAVVASSYEKELKIQQQSG